MKMYIDEIKETVNNILRVVAEAYNNAISVIKRTKSLLYVTILEVVGMMKAQDDRVCKKTYTSLGGAFQACHKIKNDKKLKVRNINNCSYAKKRKCN